jgi:hypothetical protein
MGAFFPTPSFAQAFLRMSSRSSSYDRTTNMKFAARPLSFFRPAPHNNNESNFAQLRGNKENDT